MAPQDSFIDDEDDCCPLCVEEFDLSDKGFRPCPCGYQICQFCFNNIQKNMNNLCPACRRPYDEKTIEWKVVTPEELKLHQAAIQKNAKKKADLRQREAQKREVESLNRKHLAGLRVVQKNLVYVVGLSPGIKEDEILATLRGEKYFGQYGKILKIVVSKAKPGETGQSSNSLGVYVTFEKNEDAARCINAVNGSQNGDRTLRAQLGTTKYCSAFLRGETCNNKQCMFLHVSNDSDDSYTRQDMSSFNSVITQAPLPTNASSASSSRQVSLSQAPLQHAQPLAAAGQPMARDTSKDGSEAGDSSALPAAAAWAKQRSRRGSVATSGAASSPAISHAAPVAEEAQDDPSDTIDFPEQEVNSEHPDNGSAESLVKGSTKETKKYEPWLKALLDFVASNQPLVFADLAGETGFTYPPLFDDNGGAKRRAMREQQQEEEDRLQSEQDITSTEQQGQQSVADPVEEDEPESGSLQLGGEPEDRDNVSRENSMPQFQRQAGGQLPIQRGPNGGAFGSMGSFPQSINGRPLTTLQQQQLLQMKSAQPGFLEQFQPAMSNSVTPNPAPFQQGHTRQPSRYAQVMENTSVKPTANSKFLAQQNTMMPHPQNQYYGSSMTGPPPGLKSSGTPPINGSFGQAHSFGGALGGGNIFGGKESMMAGRGGAGLGQVHDTGKREYNFPSFLHQYPSASSTPAPASGLLASLYGPQTGAFHDYGQKQKKKGKKHRHANTSSSGGGGLVNDLADPSILQARMQQYQQQSNAGVGQGLFGGQAQDDSDLTTDDVPFSIDALVSDDDQAPRLDTFGFSRSSTPAVPPGFGPPGLGPPGFAAPHALPEVLGTEALTPKAQSRIVPNAPVFVPSISPLVANASLPPTPTKAPRPSKLSKSTEMSTAETNKDTNAPATKPTLSTASGTSKSTMKAEEFPALDQGKAKEPATLPTVKSVIPPKPAQATASAKKTIPKQSGSTTPAKSTPVPALAPSLFPKLPPSTPAVTTAPVPIVRPTLTIGKIAKAQPAPKPETPLTGNTPSSTTSVFPSNYQASRQPSIASVSKIERSGTPTSEIVSDNASTNSFSRASTPPPSSKVGTAPVRTVTKSMQKRERKSTKDKVIGDVGTAKIEEEQEIAPIMGRKKKQKKEKVDKHATGATTTPNISRPVSPRLPNPETVVSELPPVAESETKAKESQAEIATQAPIKTVDVKGKNKHKYQQPPTPEPASAVTEPENTLERPHPTPASTLQELISSGEVGEVDDILFKTSTLNSRHQEAHGDQLKPTPKLDMTSEDQNTLLAGKPVHKIVDRQRIMMTPNGNCVRNLTPEEEERYLLLQKSIANQAGPTVFTSGKPNTKSKFTLIGGRAIPSGHPSFLIEPQANTASANPVSKIQHEEALSYINQYVLPSISANPHLEKTLNSNIDAEVLRSGDSLMWANPGGPRADSIDGQFSTNGSNILAHGLETMAAHFTGHDGDRTQPMTNVSMLNVTEAEQQLQFLRKETESMEKKLLAYVKKNKRLLYGSGH